MLSKPRKIFGNWKKDDGKNYKLSGRVENTAREIDQKVEKKIKVKGDKKFRK